MKQVILTHLYAEEMAIYGDKGNLISLRDVLEFNNISVKIVESGIGDSLPLYSDFYFIGGGADKDQYAVVEDLQNKKDQLLNHLENGMPLLAICGGYQLLGESFTGGDGTVIKGLNWFPVSTRAPNIHVQSRCVGNIVVIPNKNLKLSGKLVGFENHGGQTYATSAEFEPLGSVILGSGNNSTEGLEGCVKKNSIGCYFHGPCLAKNPQLLRYFSQQILAKKGEEQTILLPPGYEELNNQLLNRFAKK